MSGKWVAYCPTEPGKRDQPRVVELAARTLGGHKTRKAALTGLRHKLEREHKAAQEKVAEMGRALVNLLELEQEP